MSENENILSIQNLILSNDYKIEEIKNIKLSYETNKITKLNFIFQITDKEFNFEDVSFLINNKNLVIPNLQAKKQKNKFFFIGKIKNKNLNFKQNEISEIIDNKFLNDNLKNIIFN